MTRAEVILHSGERMFFIEKGFRVRLTGASIRLKLNIEREEIREVHFTHTYFCYANLNGMHELREVSFPKGSRISFISAHENFSLKKMVLPDVIFAVRLAYWVELPDFNKVINNSDDPIIDIE